MKTNMPQLTVGLIFLCITTMPAFAVARSGETCTAPGLASVQAVKNTNTRISNFESKSQGPTVLSVPHRGTHSAGVPNNSLLSIRQAIEQGAPMVEVDILLSSDNHAMLLHDPLLEGETNGTGIPGLKTKSQLVALLMRDPLGEIAASVHVSALYEALKYYGPCILFNIDIKEKFPARQRYTYQKVVEEMRRLVSTGDYSNALNTVYLKGTFNVNEYHTYVGQDIKYTPKIGEEIPKLATYWSQWSTEVDSNPKIKAFEVRVKQGPNDPNPSPTIKPINYVQKVQAKGLRVGMVDVSWTNWSFVTLGDKAPTPVNPNVDFRGDWDFLTRMGANYVITDRAQFLDEYLKRRGIGG